MGKYRFVKSVIRSLKRQHGQPIILYKTTTQATIDWTQGTASGRETETKTIRKAIMLPARTNRSFNYDATYLASNRNLTVGVYNLKQRDVIIDRDDIGSFGLNIRTRIRFNDLDYTIEDLQDYEEQNAVYLTIVRTEDQIDES